MTKAKKTERRTRQRTPEQAEARKLVTFLETGELLAGTLQLREAMSRILAILGRHHGMMRSSVMLLDQDTNELRIVASHGLDETEARRVRYQVGEGVSGRVAQTGKPVVVPQISREPMFLDRLGARKKPLRKELTFICVPILVNRKPVGVLGVDLDYKADRDYERATKFLSIIATMIAQAIKVDHLIESDKQRLLDENIHLKQELRERYDFSHIIGNSGPLRQVYEQVTQVARTNTTVLLRGESGAGKELIAHAIHYNSLRANKPFIKVSCAALPETLIESELFGYEKGAFTGAQGRKKGRFELAAGGTLFLDEIGDLNVSTQIKLLRVLQEREFERLGGTETIRVNVRLIAATNKNMEQAIANGEFREDLYYRLNVIRLRVPPLRERRSEVPTMVNYYINHYSSKFGRKDIQITPQATDLMMVFDWPGNVRQLCNEIQRIVARAEDGTLITPDHLSAELKRTSSPISPSGTGASLGVIQTASIPSGTLADAFAEVERRMISDALRRHNGNISRAAKELGLTRRGLYLKLERHSLSASA